MGLLDWKQQVYAVIDEPLELHWFNESEAMITHSHSLSHKQAFKKI